MLDKSHTSAIAISTSTPSPRRRAIFLDRDGTVIEHVSHLTCATEVRLLPGAANSIRRLNETGWLVVLVTNQSVVARGLAVTGPPRGPFPTT